MSNKPFPFTKDVTLYDPEMVKIIQTSIGEYIREIATQIYPDAPAAHIERIYKQQHQPHYEALALLISKNLRIENYAKTITSDTSRRIT